MKRTLILILVIALCVGAYFLWRGGDERRIRRRLDVLSQTVSKPRGSPDAAMFGRLSSLRTLFTQDCRLSPGNPIPDIQSQEGLALAYRRAYSVVDWAEVDLRDVEVDVAESRERATVRLTAMLEYQRGAEPQATGAREIEIDWEKVDDEWRISEIAVVEAVR